jgi:hypothetical protein
VRKCARWRRTTQTAPSRRGGPSTGQTRGRSITGSTPRQASRAGSTRALRAQSKNRAPRQHMPRRATSARRPSPPRREMRVARALQPPLCRAPLASVCARACAERRPVRLCYALTCGPKRRAQQPARLPTMEELGQGEGKEERPPSLRHPQEERPSSLHPLPRRQRRRQQGQGGRLLHCWGPLPHRYQRPRPRSSKNARRERRRRRSLPCLPECGGRKCVHVHMSHVPMKRRQSRRTRPSSSLLESGAVPSKTQHRRLTHERECPRPRTHKRAHTHTHTHYYCPCFV